MHVVGTDAVAPLAFTHLGQPVWFEPQCPTYPAYVVVAFALNQQSVALIALWGCGSGQKRKLFGTTAVDDPPQVDRRSAAHPM
jgi:hypothetical protein